MRVSPNSDSRCGRSRTAGSARIRSHASSAARPGWAGRFARAAAATARAASRLQRRVAGAGRRRPPRPHHVRAGGRRSGRTDRRCAGPRRTAASAPPGPPRAPSRWRCERGQPRLAQALVDHLEQRPDRRARPATGSSSGSIPVAAASAPMISRPGNGNSTFAHTPSRRPAVVPSRVESRWVSQRSIPRVGTATTSGANGSSSGVSSVSARPSARRSARSARWTWSMVTEP